MPAPSSLACRARQRPSPAPRRQFIGLGGLSRAQRPSRPRVKLHERNGGGWGPSCEREGLPLFGLRSQGAAISARNQASDTGAPFSSPGRFGPPPGACMGAMHGLFSNWNGCEAGD